ncbi:hypothetical protein GCM10010265_39130 [Streptomyces griseoincarnatus]|nr:hypothetical protein GCM10010265_39130 [Streptomyces griseoincarnatus]
MGVVVLGLARECVLERFGAWTRQPLRAPTPTPSPPRRGRLHRLQWRVAAADVANCGHSCRLEVLTKALDVSVGDEAGGEAEEGFV